MRHDWTLLCNEIQAQDEGTIGLGNVFNTMRVSGALGIIGYAESVPFEPPAILVSQWTAEFDIDRRLHSATVQLMAPGGEHILWTDRLYFDFRDLATIRMIYIMQNLHFVGIGTYEYHVVLEELAIQGEWGRACLTAY